jgi:hypothetical protein
MPKYAQPTFSDLVGPRLPLEKEKTLATIKEIKSQLCFFTPFLAAGREEREGGGRERERYTDRRREARKREKERERERG